MYIDKTVKKSPIVHLFSLPRLIQSFLTYEKDDLSFKV